MANPPLTLSAEEVAQARRLYDDNATLDSICTRLKVSKTWFRKFREANGWPPRPCFGRASTSSPGRTAASERLVQRLEATVEREYARVERALQSGASSEIDARTLASLVKSLAELKRIKRENRVENEHDAAEARDDPPRELAELRAELARRIERITGARAPE